MRVFKAIDFCQGVVRRIKLAMASGCPYQTVSGTAGAAIGANTSLESDSGVEPNNPARVPQTRSARIAYQERLPRSRSIIGPHAGQHDRIRSSRKHVALAVVVDVSKLESGEPLRHRIQIAPLQRNRPNSGTMAMSSTAIRLDAH